MATDPEIGQEKALRATVASMEGKVASMRNELEQLHSEDPHSDRIGPLEMSIADTEQLRVRMSLEAVFGDVEEIEEVDLEAAARDQAREQAGELLIEETSEPGPDPVDPPPADPYASTNHTSEDGTPLAHDTLFGDV